MKIRLLLLISLLLAACASAPVAPPPDRAVQRSPVPRPVRAHRRRRHLCRERRDEALRAHRNRRPAHGGGIQQRFAEALYTKGELQARVRVGADPERGRGLRRAHRELPFPRDHDGGAREGNRSPGPLPKGVRRRHLEPQRRRLLFHRPRQPEPGQAADRRRIRPQRQRHDDDRFSSAARPPGRAHAGARRANDRGDVHEQPRRGIVHPGTARRRLLVGARGHREGPGIRRRRTTRSA